MSSEARFKFPTHWNILNSHKHYSALYPSVADKCKTTQVNSQVTQLVDALTIEVPMVLTGPQKSCPCFSLP